MAGTLFSALARSTLEAAFDHRSRGLLRSERPARLASQSAAVRLTPTIVDYKMSRPLKPTGVPGVVARM